MFFPAEVNLPKKGRASFGAKEGAGLPTREQGVKNISMRGSELWDWLGCLCLSDLWNPPDFLQKIAVFKESKLSAFTNESAT